MAASLVSAQPQEAWQSIGSLKGVIVDVTLGSNDYLTGGIDFSPALPAGTLIGAIVLGTSVSWTLRPVIDLTNKKVLLFEGAAGDDAEEANGTSDAITVRILALLA